MIDYQNVTPAIKQYIALKAQYQECLLFYRLGDFYELFFDDAIEASKVLNIVLTKKGSTIPMCGVPFHSSESYLNKLVKLGYKVAICEQLETAEEAKKRGYKELVKRDVVRIITPGTLLEDSLLEANESNYLACIAFVNNTYAIAWMELSTGLFYFHATNLNDLESDLMRINPKELLISDKLSYTGNILNILRKHKFLLTRHSDSFFSVNKAYSILCDVYKIKTLKGLGDFTEAEISVCGSLLEYVRITQKNNLPKLEYPKAYARQDFMFIDGAALQSLELFCTQSGEKKGSLISVIDYTITSSGSRLLRRYLSSPMICSYTINQKLDVVEIFVNDRDLSKHVRKILQYVSDLERILTRIKILKCSPKDLYCLKRTLDAANEMSELVKQIDNNLFKRFSHELHGYEDLLKLMTESLIENNVNNVKDGGFINPNYNSRLLELIYIESNSNELIKKLCNKYRQMTGINTLKILYNNVIGYYVEVSPTYSIKNEFFIHRQTLVSGIRYVTDELKELEYKITTAHDEAVDLEIKMFNEICVQVAEKSHIISSIAYVMAELDVLSSFAELAVQNNYVRPIIDDSYEFDIKKGRHPVIEMNGNFIANDVNLMREERMCLITGPNMAGKSTFLRQNALIAILSHMGSFVPAEYAHIGIIDKIFSRVGASDNISLGYSTFMVEMIETASIVNQATDKSLVILDEIGRGTGVYDGLSIAWAVIEHIHNINNSRAIVATHYHELSQLSYYLKSLKCFCMKIEEWEGKVVFLHEIVPGFTNRSYGIHIAKLAGFPASILNRAEHFMQKLTKDKELILEDIL
ncbi:DNA mismatch repair protein MutS [Neoehrlichia mikurensis]|uniref:DNA mismatch repair protein MutS n=1 Tax=Neoehrlichia mikurensis TaxID=89586 RepID=A0A9Q9F386_9RICK|nr:DNA mismatch repair protein MutS [Neoehrlichia mikurensis]QXK92097.1 DNA mismatch repair protein MutS [Neoehrlichia mikurensis]QXK92554.1 DNA mismatch repair protein MutS [Neoehrlichia mikurensis]QXK93790.1 DNA mismatch repair protein MutS [Neoehrlichia mikurensis]UTO55235.1 DNA mismatch repair protein MutS [Neoehrlichia mikurensis]UTO56155.1 DNA mismatch repair protein MutS [Neoehrlichia mikurensis]